MKKLIILFAVFISLVSSAQSVTNGYDPYVAMGISMSSGQFSTNSYPYVEAGVCHQNVAVAVAMGRGKFEDALSPVDNISNYFWEASISPYYDFNSIRVSVFFGYGAYYNTDHYFRDYGFDTTYNVGSFGYGIGFNNWDTRNYISPSITYNF